jgi:opacity protein-like surface antigen
VFGLRDMIDATSLSKNIPFSTIPFTGRADSRTHWFDTLTARGGYLVVTERLVLCAGWRGVGTQVGEISNDRTGWTAGAGMEWMFAPHWSVFTEYNFMGFGTRSAAFTACGGSCVLSAKANIQDVVIGLNYKFGWGP